MEVSWNRGTLKSSILMAFSIINHPFGGTPIYGNPRIASYTSAFTCTISSYADIPHGPSPVWIAWCLRWSLPALDEVTIYRKLPFMRKWRFKTCKTNMQTNVKTIVIGLCFFAGKSTGNPWKPLDLMVKTIGYHRFLLLCSFKTNPMT